MNEKIEHLNEFVFELLYQFKSYFKNIHIYYYMPYDEYLKYISKISIQIKI